MIQTPTTSSPRAAARREAVGRPRREWTRSPPGAYGFHCSLHSWMVGKLVVNQSGGGPAVPAPPGGGGGGGSGSPDPATLVPPAPAEPLGDGAWPSYGHDVMNSRDAGAAGPSVAQALQLGAVWSHLSEDGDITGTPVIARNRLVVGDSRRHRHRAGAADRRGAVGA